MDLIHDVENINLINMLIKTYQILYVVGISHCVFWQNLSSSFRVLVILAFNFPLDLLGRIAWVSEINEIDKLS